MSTPKHFVPMEIDDDRVRSLRIPFDVLEECGEKRGEEEIE